MTQFLSGTWPLVLLFVSLVICAICANANTLDLNNYVLPGLCAGIILGYFLGKCLGHPIICVCSGILLGIGFGLTIRKENE